MATFNIPVPTSQSLSTASFNVPSLTISANATGEFSFTNIARSGYTPIGIVSISLANAANNGKGSSKSMAEYSSLTSTSALVRVRNLGSGEIILQCTILVLYLSN